MALYAEADLTGRVTGAAPRSRVRAENLPHAATAVLLRDAAGRVYAHRRTPTKDVFPDCYDVWAGGVVLAGEDPTTAAGRELAEELGVRDCPIRALFRLWYADAHTNYLAYAFVADYDPRRCGPVVHQPEEVADGWWMEWDELVRRSTDPDWPMVPDGRALVRYLLLEPNLAGTGRSGPDGG